MIKEEEIRQCVLDVYCSLQKYGYNPVNQIIGYLVSGDPTYITSKERARYKIQQVEREEILEELVRNYTETLVETMNLSIEDTQMFLKEAASKKRQIVCSLTRNMF